MKTSPLNNNQQVNTQNSPSRTLQVAREFEAVFTSMMMKSMRKTVFDGGLMQKSIGEKIYTDMLDVEYAKIVSNNASLGLAEQIVKQLEDLGYTNGLQALRSMGNRHWMIDPRFIPGKRNFSVSRSTKQQVAHWNDLIEEASTKYKVDKDLITAVITQESAGNPHAVSRAGAKGLMQLIDTTAHAMGVNQVFNPRENIMGGSKYLSSLLKQFNGNETLALASYNAGPGAVEKYQGVPPYKETQNYIQRVLSIREGIKQANSQSTEETTKDE